MRSSSVIALEYIFSDSSVDRIKMHVTSVTHLLPTNAQEDEQQLGGIRANGRQTVVATAAQKEVDKRHIDVVMEDATHRQFRWGEDGLTDDDAEGEDDPDCVRPTVVVGRDVPMDVGELVRLFSSVCLHCRRLTALHPEREDVGSRSCGHWPARHSDCGVLVAVLDRPAVHARTKHYPAPQREHAPSVLAFSIPAFGAVCIPREPRHADRCLQPRP
jgi:hypothetical protein